ncbi:hypothetical protein RSC2_00279 [Bacillus paralicheniformis]|nr:hypothetical protein RSC1_02846 [Bacillus paralicheniformis]BCE08483.1 hypothetical protein RSC2_00279 [Bacillus paralicheniformis]
MNKTKPPVIVLIGPTAVGKTKLSVMLAEHLNAEIISGDSMQIYKRMDIGTAKIKEEEMNGVPHHLIDIKEPTESFSVAEYQEIVRQKIAEIGRRGKLPMIVGGQGSISSLSFTTIHSQRKRATLSSERRWRRSLTREEPNMFTVY